MLERCTFRRETITDPISHLLHLRVVRRSDRPFVIAEDCHLTVSIIVVLDLLLNCTLRLHVLQQVRHREGRIVRAEDLRTKSWHVIREMLVELSGAEPIEDLVAIALRRLLEDFQVLEDLWVNLDFVVESDGILAEKVEDHLVRRG